MSIHVVSWVLRHSEETLGRRLVLLVLADKANDDGSGAWPSVATICTEARMTRRPVQEALRRMEQSGAIRKAGKHKSGATIYDVVMEGAESAQAREDVQGGADDDAEGARNATEGARLAAPEPSLDQPSEGQPSTTLAAVAAYDPLKGTKIDGRNLPWDALVKATSADEVAEKGRIARALKTLREVIVRDSSPQTFAEPATGEWWIARQISARANLYQARWPNIELTPTALAANWSRVVTAQPGQDPHATMEAAQRGIDSARGAA